MVLKLLYDESSISGPYFSSEIIVMFNGTFHIAIHEYGGYIGVIWLNIWVNISRLWDN